MTAINEVLITCDGEEECLTDEPFGVDVKYNTAKRARHEASREGWTYSGGKDYCPTCSERRKRNLKSR